MSVDVTAIVLAGGRSARFGSNKLAANVDGAPLLHRAVDAVGQVAGHTVVVLAPGADAPSFPGDPGDRSFGRVAIARDAQPFGGPVAGLSSGLRALEGRAVSGVVLVVAGDMPSLQPPVLTLLIEAVLAGASHARLEAQPPAPLPFAARGSELRAATARVLDTDRHSLRGLASILSPVLVPAATWRAVDPAGQTLVDIDSPGDLASHRVVR